MTLNSKLLVLRFFALGQSAEAGLQRPLGGDTLCDVLGDHREADDSAVASFDGEAVIKTRPRWRPCGVGRSDMFVVASETDSFAHRDLFDCSVAGSEKGRRLPDDPSAVYPKSATAAGFQLVTIPSVVVLKIASPEPSTIAAVRLGSSASASFAFR